MSTSGVPWGAVVDRVEESNLRLVPAHDGVEVLADRPDPLERRAGLEASGFEPLFHLALEASDQLQEDSFLAPEVVVEDRLGHARSGDDLADRRSRVTAAGKQL